MIVEKIEFAKDTVHQFTNQVISVSDSITQSSRDYITRDEVLIIFQQNQQQYTEQLNIILVIIGIGVTILGVIIPIIQYLNNRKYEDDIKETIKSFDEKIESKVKEKIKTEFENIINVKTDELEQTITNLSERAKNEDENLQIRIDLPIKMLEGYSRLISFNHLEAFQLLIEALYYSFKLNNHYYIDTVDNRITDVIKSYKLNRKVLDKIITGDDIGRAYSNTINKEEDTNIRNNMDRYINSYRKEIEEINNSNVE